MNYQDICRKFEVETLRDANLLKADLSEANLSGADLSEAKINVGQIDYVLAGIGLEIK